ncbi:MAG: bifunctional 3-deoxy-7-phosphoheptulonate synthase/chorismate mutase type II [Saprospiraceae bacterium]|nr:bifunctional 3-deoxy-7-phosphoheptulonate synthase/chorismate mutase type II [Saprospiraceae bacterium]
MDFEPLFPGHPHHLIIAGPCSAETEEQVLQTAKGLAGGRVHLFRAGIWKPRTRPDSFEGIGDEGLPWLKKVKEETGLRVTTEVANAQHVEKALKHDIDVLWIGARTTVSPFAVSEIAQALKGVDIPVMIKNPVNPDIKLWIGAIERFIKADIKKLAAIHRGFSFFGKSAFRNVPRWQIPIELMRSFPKLPVICDCSHICGRRDTLAGIAQTALDLNFKGLMMEVHPTPDEAWSDAAQQITPERFLEILDGLFFRNPTISDTAFLETLENLRHQIDDIDTEILRLLGDRMKITERIGEYKESNNIAILQPERWAAVLEYALSNGNRAGLTDQFILDLFKAIHQESINRQAKVMQSDEIAAE